MGKDKFENEELIKYGWDEDVWFHVDKLSSAHVYLRLPPGTSWDNIPTALLDDIAQLTKANSIEGNKKQSLTVIYTPWSNLKKTPGMETGQVAFHKDGLVKRIHVQARNKEILSRLNKTREEKYPDLAKERLERDRRERTTAKEYEKQKKREALEKEKRQKEADALKNYANVFTEENMVSNVSTMKRKINLEEDFM